MNPSSPSPSPSVFSVLDFGARGDGETNDAAALQRAIDAAASAGGGTVLVPPGRSFLTGTIRLKSHVELHLAAGSRLLASPAREDYPNRILLEVEDAENVSLTGTGTLDGRARLFMTAEKPYMFQGTDWRPRLIGFTACRNVTVKDVTIKDSANWGLHLAGCEDVVVHGIRILNDLKVPNCDGIDPDRCRNVRISDCHIEAGDDCIVLKATRPGTQYGAGADLGPCENITVTGCTLISTSCAIKIGSETVGPIRNAVFSNCIIRRSNRGLGIMLRDEGSVENLLFSDMIIETRLFQEDWWGRAEPIYVTAHSRDGKVKPGVMRNIRFRNILCRGENGVFLAGSPECYPENILFENVRVEVVKTSKWKGGRQDRRPAPDAGLRDHPTAAFYLEKAQKVTLRHCEADWGGEDGGMPGEASGEGGAGAGASGAGGGTERPDYFGAALESHGVRELHLENFQGEAAHPDRGPATRIEP